MIAADWYGVLPDTDISAADQVLAGDSDSRLWLATKLHPPDPNAGQVPPQAVQHVDVSGHPRTPRYRVPDGYVALQGMASGSLLVTLAEQGPADTSLFALWNPRSRRVLRRYDRVLAATGTTIAWVAAGCGPQRCPVHLSDLAVGTDTPVASPQGAWANGGAFSPDGRYLAVVFSADVDASASGGADAGPGLGRGHRHPAAACRPGCRHERC